MNDQIKIIVKNNLFENPSAILRLLFGLISTTFLIITITFLTSKCFKGNCILELIFFNIIFLSLSSIFLVVGIWENFGITTIQFENNLFKIEFNYRIFKYKKSYNPCFMSEISHNIPENDFFKLFKGMETNKLKFSYHSNKITIMPTISSKEAITIIYEVNKLIRRIKNNKNSQ